MHTWNTAGDALAFAGFYVARAHGLRCASRSGRSVFGLQSAIEACRLTGRQARRRSETTAASEAITALTVQQATLAQLSSFAA